MFITRKKIKGFGKKLVAKNEEFQRIKDAIMQKVADQKAEEQKRRQLQLEEKQKTEDTIDRVKKAEYLEDLLNGAFFDELKRMYDLNLIALGVYDKPLKKINLDVEESPQAHLDVEATQNEIRFLASDSYNSISDRVLPVERSSIYELLQPSEDEPEQNQDPEQPVVVKSLPLYSGPEEIPMEEVEKYNHT